MTTQAIPNPEEVALLRAYPGLNVPGLAGLIDEFSRGKKDFELVIYEALDCVLREAPKLEQVELAQAAEAAQLAREEAEMEANAQAEAPVYHQTGAPVPSPASTQPEIVTGAPVDTEATAAAAEEPPTAVADEDNQIEVTTHTDSSYSAMSEDDMADDFTPPDHEADQDIITY